MKNENMKKPIIDIKNNKNDFNFKNKTTPTLLCSVIIINYIMKIYIIFWF